MNKKIIRKIKDFNKIKFLKSHYSITLQTNNCITELLKDDINLSSGRRISYNVFMYFEEIWDCRLSCIKVSCNF